MKSQSALEFITTYGFMFLIIAIAIVLVFVLSNSARNYVPTRCTGVSGFSCQSDSFITDAADHNSKIVLLLTNSQSVPVNVIGILVTLTPNQTTAGPANPDCAPTYLIPGNTMTCSLTFGGITQPIGGAISGSYVIKAQFCNAGASQLTNTICVGNYTNVTYGGSFATQVIPGTA